MCMIILMFFSVCNNKFIETENNSNEGYLGMSLLADFKIFDGNSPWNSPIGEDPEINPDSDVMIQTLIKSLKEELDREKPALGGNYKEWTSPIHVIDADKSPKKDVPTTDTEGRLYETVDPDHDGIAEDIPLPDGVWADPSEDGHMILVDPKKRIVWEFSCAYQTKSRGWKASCIDIWNLNDPGYREPFSGTYWWRSGVRGSGSPYIAGLIRPEEIEADEINHALAVGTPVNRLKISEDVEWKRELCSPIAARTDGWRIGPQYIPEGARIQLNPNLELDSLNLSKEARIITKTLQKYGAFVVDNSKGFPLYFQNLGPDGGKWNEYPGLIDISKIPISEFRVLECNIVVKR